MTQRPAQAPNTSLNVAVLQGDLDAVRRHIEAGADLNATDPFGSTPLVVASTFGKTEVAQVLIQAGADLAIPNQDGSTPLHLAAFFANPKLVQELLDQGANKRLRNNSGSTALDIVSSPFAHDKHIYDAIGKALKPVGLRLDYERIENLRPKLAKLLQSDPEELSVAEYQPQSVRDWRVSTPQNRGLRRAQVAELYLDAAEVEKLYGLLVVKDGELVAERYFNGSSATQKVMLQSVTKSFTSAQIGIALERGCFASIDQKLFEFFPELSGRVQDARKRQITIRQLLQMRSGYPWEETAPQLWQQLVSGDLLTPMLTVALVDKPSSQFNYSNFSSHWLGVIVARACGTDLRSFAETQVLAPIGAELGEWYRDRQGNYIGLAGMQMTARDMARFGQLYLDGGKYGNTQVIPATWVEDSLQSYSDDTWIADPPQQNVGRYFRQLGYGYQWWSARVGEHEVDYAAGHGGQLIILLRELDLLIVVTSDPFDRQHDDEAWKHEQANYNLVGSFIRSLRAPRVSASSASE